STRHRRWTDSGSQVVGLHDVEQLTEGSDHRKGSNSSRLKREQAWQQPKREKGCQWIGRGYLLGGATGTVRELLTARARQMRSRPERPPRVSAGPERCEPPSGSTNPRDTWRS